MKRKLAFAWFGFMLFLGVLLLAWLLYNQFVEELPQTKGRSRVVSWISTAVLIYTGWNKLRGLTRPSEDKAHTE